MLKLEIEDVTDLFSNAREHLVKYNTTDPLIRTSEFSLLESMSAIELMDQKMDTCHGLNLNKSFSDAVHENICNHQLNSSSMFATMLWLVRSLVQFLNGSNVLDSTHCCLLMWSKGLEVMRKKAPRNALDDILLLYSAYMVRVLSLTFSVALQADIYEDEDFNPSFRSAIIEAEAEVELIMRSFAGHIHSDDALTVVSQSLLTFLKDLMQCMQSIHAFLHNMVESSVSMRNGSFAGDRISGEQISEELLNLEQNIKYCRVSLNQTEQLVLNSEILQNEIMDANIPFLQPLLCRVQQLGPIKNKVDIDIKIVFVSFGSIFSEFDEVIAGTKLILRQPNVSFETLLYYARKFSIRRSIDSSPFYHLLARSLLLACLQSFLPHLSQALKNSMLLRGLPDTLLSSQLYTEWLSEGSIVVAAWDFLRTLTVHRSRQIYRMEHLLSLWSQVSADSLQLDDHIQIALSLQSRQLWCSSWTMSLVTIAMENYMELLVDTDVLDVVEFGYFYWYYDFILTSHIHAIETLRKMRFELDLSMERSNPVSAKLVELSMEDLLLRSRSQLVRGLFRTSVFLNKSNLIDNVAQGSLKFMTKIFAKRFQTFSEMLNPCPLEYDDFLQCVSTADSSNETLIVMISNASACFENARKYLEDAKKLAANAHMDKVLMEINILKKVRHDLPAPLLCSFVSDFCK